MNTDEKIHECIKTKLSGMTRLQLLTLKVLSRTETETVELSQVLKRVHALDPEVKINKVLIHETIDALMMSKITAWLDGGRINEHVKPLVGTLSPNECDVVVNERILDALRELLEEHERS